jgi:endogenous inhibitor of DNA gyrase (YacG/DUF329 family)
VAVPAEIARQRRFRWQNHYGMDRTPLGSGLAAPHSKKPSKHTQMPSKISTGLRCANCQTPVIWSSSHRNRYLIDPSTEKPHELDCKPPSAQLSKPATPLPAVHVPCKFCRSPIEWRQDVPFNLDGTRHAARCPGRPAGRVKNVIEAMIAQSRSANRAEAAPAHAEDSNTLPPF